MTIVKINAEAYHQNIARRDIPVLIEFSAPWCSYCRRLEPALEDLARQYGDTLFVGQINIDDEPELAVQEQIELVPTLLLYRNGQLLGSIVAPESRAQLTEFIEGSLSLQSRQAEEEPVHDMVIVGGGPGGYTAALYAARAGLDTVVVEKLSAGGQMALTHQIDNYPGFEEGIDGFSLGVKMQQGAERFGARSRLTEVLSAELGGPVKTLHTSDGPIRSRTVVLATGASPRELDIPGEQELMGRGLHYCAACDGAFYRGKTVVVVGGGNTAAADALVLSRICKKVIVVHRRDTLRATKIYHAPLMNAENVEFRWNSTVSKLLQDGRVSGVVLRDIRTGEESMVACDGVFVSVGRKPASELAAGQVELDGAGYIVADESTRASLPGVFAVGDVRTKELRQIVTAVADGAAAAHAAEEYLAEHS